MPESLFLSLGALAERFSQSRNVFLFLDFDGTLVPIRDRPSECFLAEDVRHTLSQLSSIPPLKVGIISGRALSDLRDRVGLQQVVLAGNHGLEIEGPGFAYCEQHAKYLSVELRELVNRIGQELQRFAGAWVEDKKLSASVHFRQVNPAEHSHVRDVVQQVTAAAVAQRRFILRPGKQVVEIRPAVGWNKSNALHWIVERMSKLPSPDVIYFGDDTTDEDVFTEWPTAITVSVGNHHETAARFSVADHDEVHRSLLWMLKVFRNQ